MAIHNMLKYAYYHGVKILFLENPETLGFLKTLWIKKGERKNSNYNYRVQIFRNRVVERIAMKAPLYAINIEYIDLKGTTHSEEHDMIMKRYGLDKHTASAYLIALRGIKRYDTESYNLKFLPHNHRDLSSVTSTYTLTAPA